MAEVKRTRKKSAGQDGFQVLMGLDGVRQNPTMYLSERGAPMAYRCVKEIVDNAYDEASNGRNKLIEVILNYDAGVYIVADAAGGIPTDMKTLKDGTKESILTSAFSRTHAGGKFNTDSYKHSSGTHGVGVAAVNAVSESTRVWTTYKGVLKNQNFSKGAVVGSQIPKKVKSLDKDVGSLLKDKTSKYGTIVAIELDQTVVSENVMRGKKLPKDFKRAEPIATDIAKWLHSMALLNPGLLIRLSVIKEKKRKDFEFHNKKDLAYIAKYLCDKHEYKAIGKPFVFKNDNISCAVVWTDHTDADYFETFVNNSPTADGGWHVVGFTNALSSVLKKYATTGKSKKAATFTSSDIQIGLVGMFDWRMHGASYTSQVKDKLASRVDKEVSDFMLPALEEYFEANQRVAKAIIKRAEVMNKGRAELAAVVKSMAEVKKKKKGNALPAALAQADKAKPHERELFLVEGDSAKGPATDGRDSRYQEVLAAGGKPLNALTASLAKVLAHKEIQNLLLSMGADLKSLDPKDENPQLSTDKLRVAHLILLMDADPDGPLHPDTRVITADGRNPSIKEMADEWEKNQEPFKVCSRRGDGELVTAEAIFPRITTYKQKALRITFGGHTEIECTHAHKWKTPLGNYEAAQKFRVGDLVDSAALQDAGMPAKIVGRRHHWAENPAPNIRITAIEEVEYADPQPYYCLTVPVHGNFMVMDNNGQGICSHNCHIAVLFMAAIYRLMPNLFKEGRVWCVDAPLYAAVKNGKLYGGMTFAECREAAPSTIKDGDIVRIKGWGEVDETFMEPIAFDPKQRKLIRINPFENAEQEKFFRGVVAEDASHRRALLGLED